MLAHLLLSALLTGLAFAQTEEENPCGPGRRGEPSWVSGYGVGEVRDEGTMPLNGGLLAWGYRPFGVHPPQIAMCSEGQLVPAEVTLNGGSWAMFRPIGGWVPGKTYQYFVYYPTCHMDGELLRYLIDEVVVTAADTRPPRRLRFRTAEYLRYLDIRDQPLWEGGEDGLILLEGFRPSPDLAAIGVWVLESAEAPAEGTPDWVNPIHWRHRIGPDRLIVDNFRQDPIYGDDTTLLHVVLRPMDRAGNFGPETRLSLPRAHREVTWTENPPFFCYTPCDEDRGLAWP